MHAEIERKFLAQDAKVIGRAEAPPRAIRQAYLATGKTSVRVRIADASAWINIKGAGSGLTRLEYEHPIPVDAAADIMERLAVTAIIDKDRYQIDDGVLWTVDVFKGANAPLVLAEIELSSPTEGVRPPSWLGDEVSADLRYHNVYLALHPYSAWRRDG